MTFISCLLSTTIIFSGFKSACVICRASGAAVLWSAEGTQMFILVRLVSLCGLLDIFTQLPQECQRHRQTLMLYQKEEMNKDLWLFWQHYRKHFLLMGVSW